MKKSYISIAVPKLVASASFNARGRPGGLSMEGLADFTAISFGR
jgi:hypothetical protein